MVKIAFLLSDLESGGAQRVVSILADNLHRTNQIVEIILFSSSNQFFYPNVRIIDLGIHPHSSLLLRMINVLKRILKLYRIRINEDYSSVISFLEAANFYNVLTRTSKSKAIISIRNSKQSGVLSKGIFFDFVLKHSSKIVFPSHDLKLHYDSKFKNIIDKTITINNPIFKFIKDDKNDVDYFDFSLPYILSVGRLEPQKGQWLLIEAFNQIRVKYPELRLVIIGEGSLREFLMTRIKKHGLEDRVLLPGKIENLAKYYENCKLLVQPSLHEGFPNVILEGLLYGCVVISTNCMTGPREILSPNQSSKSISDYNEDNYGILIEFKDYSVERLMGSDNLDEINALGNTILKILSNDSLLNYFSSQGELRAKEYSIDIIGSKWIDIINSI